MKNPVPYDESHEQLRILPYLIPEYPKEEITIKKLTDEIKKELGATSVQETLQQESREIKNKVDGVRPRTPQEIATIAINPAYRRY